MEAREMVLMNSLKGRNRGLDIENRLTNTVGKGVGGQTEIEQH